jgi:hypothetical protein
VGERANPAFDKTPYRIRPLLALPIAALSDQRTSIVSKKSTAFEQRVERIHRLLEGEDAVITWDDRIADPDNQSRPRQIDVTIRRARSFTIVECRIHRDAQDVTWIEGLIGRRASLHADAVIAVSNSGFTQGAEAKAAQFGIILRDFNSLTEDEIRNWGKQRKVELIFFEFTNNTITFQLAGVPVPPLSLPTIGAILSIGADCSTP